MAGLFFHHDGRRRRDMIGLDAATLARRAGFEVPAGTRVLIAERKYVSDTDAYNRELLAPVLPWYVEDDWMHACEKALNCFCSIAPGIRWSSTPATRKSYASSH